MKQLMKGEFLPPDYEQILFQQYQRCRQRLRTVHEYTAEFMRLSECNDLRESEGQQVARYVDGLKLQIRDKIGVTVLRSMCEAKNMALRAEFMLNDKNTRFDGGGRRYGLERAERSGAYRTVDDKEKGIVEGPGTGGEKRADRVMEKRPIEPKEGQKQPNPYARPILGKCYRCNQPGHRSNECPNQRTVNIVEREGRRKSAMTLILRKRSMRITMKGQNLPISSEDSC